MSGGSGGAERQLSANLGSIGSARASSDEMPGLPASDVERLHLAQARLWYTGVGTRVSEPASIALGPCSGHDMGEDMLIGCAADAGLGWSRFTGLAGGLLL